jgi:signal recognition particle GTPase
LKPGGFFLFADFGDNKEIEKLTTQFVKSDLKIVRFENITDNVIEALKLATPDREELIREILPKFFQNLGRNFAALEGSSTYNSFLTKQFEYVFYVLKK